MSEIQSSIGGWRPRHRPGLQRDRQRGLRLVTAALAAAVAGGLCVSAGSSAAGAAIPVSSATPVPKAPNQFSAQPYSAADAQQRSSFSYELQPGHHILDQFVVKNLSSAPESFLVYGEDATNVASTGGYAFEQRAQMHNTAVGLWITAGTTHLTVPPGKEAVATFQLAIPANAPPGDHLGGLIVEEVKAPAPQNKPVAVEVVLRVAIPLYVHVVGKSFPALTIENLEVFHQSPVFPYLNGSKVAVRFDLVNTGNVIVDPSSVTVSITGQLSGTIHKYTVHQTGAAQSRANPLPQQMLPGAKLTLTEEWSGIPPFDPLTGRVSASAVQPGVSEGLSTTASTAFWYFPWIVVLLGLVLVALVVGVILIRRRRAAVGGESHGSGPDPNGGGPRSAPTAKDRGTLEEAGI